MPQQKVQQQPKPKSSVLLLLFTEIISICAGFYLMRSIFITQDIEILNFIPIDLHKEGKAHLIFYSLFLFGLFEFVLAATIIFFRMLLLKGDPVNQNDPLIIRTLNRALTNSIEWAVMFYPTFTYFTLYKANDADWKLCQLLGIGFVVARVIHAIGYLLSLVGASTGRAAGVVLSVACVLGSVGGVFGVNPFILLRQLGL